MNELRAVFLLSMLWLVTVVTQNIAGTALANIGVQLNVFHIVAMLMVLCRKDYPAVFLTLLFGSTADAFSQNYFGVFTLVYFVTALLLRPLAKNLYRNSYSETLFFYLLCACVMHIFVVLLLLLAGYEMTFWKFAQRIVLLEILPSAVVAVFGYNVILWFDIWLDGSNRNVLGSTITY